MSKIYMAKISKTGISAVPVLFLLIDLLYLSSKIPFAVSKMANPKTLELEIIIVYL